MNVCVRVGDRQHSDKYTSIIYTRLHIYRHTNTCTSSNIDPCQGLTPTTSHLSFTLTHYLARCGSGEGASTSGRGRGGEVCLVDRLVLADDHKEEGGHGWVL